MLGHDRAHKVQSVKSNFMLRGPQKMTIHRKADELRCWHFWYGPWKVGRFFEFALKVKKLKKDLANLDTRRSHTGYVLMLNWRATSWKSTEQKRETTREKRI
jgi:hypothetical protein